MSTPIFSIIIPVYNAEEGLKVCLDSIKSQTFSDFEVILVNDGSTDKSPLICDEYSIDDSRFRTIHISNSGVSHARNLGIENARGQYITFVDSDDYIEPNTLSNYLEAFKENDKIDAVKCGYYREITEKETQIVSIPNNISISDKSDLFKLLEQSSYYSFVWNLCIKRSAIGDVRFYEDINWLEDHIFGYQCYFNCRKILILSAPLYHYMIHDVNKASLSYIKNPWVINKAMDREYYLKMKLNNNKYQDVNADIKTNYLHNIHRLINILYTTHMPYTSRKKFLNITLRSNAFIYKEETIYYNNKIPFIIRDFSIKIIYYLRKIIKKIRSKNYDNIKN